MDRVQHAQRALLATAICAEVIGHSLPADGDVMAEMAKRVTRLVEPFVFVLPSDDTLYRPVKDQVVTLLQGCLQSRSERSPCREPALQAPIRTAMHLTVASAACGLLHEAALLLARQAILEKSTGSGDKFARENAQLVVAAVRCAELVRPCDAHLHTRAQNAQEAVLQKCPAEDEERLYNFLNRSGRSAATSTVRNAADQLRALVHAYEDNDILDDAVSNLKRAVLVRHLAKLARARS
jgi:hypothetical protein